MFSRSSVFAVALIGLLAVNATYFAVAQSASKATDALAWLVLLTLFELETHRPRWLMSPRRRLVLRAARVAAGAAVVAAAIAYILEDNVLDAINSALWIAVVILLEAELRWPKIVQRTPRVFTGAAVTLYAGLAVLVVVWALGRAWLDAYDAALWLVAFVALELNVIGRREAAT